MSTRYRRPRLPSHYYVLFEPPDRKGDEVLHFVSDRRRIVLKGHSFREFKEYVIPLLDGKHTVEEIAAETSDIFELEDLETGLGLLAEQGLIEDVPDASPAFGEASIEPQLNYFHEVSESSSKTQERLSKSTVTVFGLMGPGATVALALASAHVGTVRCIDSEPVGPADPYLSQVFQPGDVGAKRAEAVRQRIHSAAPGVRVVSHSTPFESEAQIAEAIRGSDFVICCIDQGLSSLIYKLNRVCLSEGIRWTSCSASGMEVVVGPTVRPYITACYLCYKMRAVACAENPEHDFVFQRMLDKRKTDDSAHRENITFAAGLAANALGLEALKELSGCMQPSTVGKVLVIDLMEMSMKKHVLLRKPWCPACFAHPEGANAASPQSAGS